MYFSNTRSAPQTPPQPLCHRPRGCHMPLGFLTGQHKNIQDELSGERGHFSGSQNKRSPLLAPLEQVQSCQHSALLGNYNFRVYYSVDSDLKTAGHARWRTWAHACGKSSDNQPCPGELTCNVQDNWQSTAESPFSVWQDLYLWKVLIINPLRTLRWVSHLPGRERVEYLHKMTCSMSRGERKLKLTGISSLNCISLVHC